MKTIQFTAFGDPKGQPRPRAFSRGGMTRMYDPGTAEGWKGLIAAAAQEHKPVAQLEGPLHVSLLFWFARPKSHSGSKGLKPTAPEYHTGKPDADNLAKAVLDCITQLGFWKDDAQVSSLNVRKKYSNGTPGCLIEITSIEV
jgi:Holliday junction resolvase RusA-like endonuclease